MRRGHVVLPAALVAGTLSGAPSTLHAVATGRPVLRAAAAAGELLGRPGAGRGVFVHAAMTLAWTSVLVVVLPQRRTMTCGALAGLAIAGLDLTIAERRFPTIAALPRMPQVADHVLFGALVGVAVGRRGSCRPVCRAEALVSAVRTARDRGGRGTPRSP
ncbi:MAG: hypothetical protein M3499_02000 [Actinomycetota bacterium]|nr:hypothetical protein [Actinomycetota bacterium]